MLSYTEAFICYYSLGFTSSKKKSKDLIWFISQHFLEDRIDGLLLSYKGNSVDILIQLSGYFNHGYLPCEGLKTQPHKPEASFFPSKSGVFPPVERALRTIRELSATAKMCSIIVPLGVSFRAAPC